MKKVVAAAFIGFVLAACTSSIKNKEIGDSIVATKKPVKPVAIIETPVVDSVKLAKEWLLSNTARFFKEQALKDDTVMFSKQYLEYKHDAIGREYDGLTEQQFEDKWRKKYNTKLANTGSILTGQQDEINPKVTACSFKNKTEDQGFIFNVIIEDADMENKYVHKRDIKVIPVGNTFVIDDILEYD